jgi:probable F420-dependent oxidoreductase
MFDELGKFGVFRNIRALRPELALTLEQLGFGALWIGGSPNGDLLKVEALLDATSTIMVATGIVNTWKDDAQTVAASYHRIEARHPGRFLLGIGVGHREQTGPAYGRPYEALVSYLDELDAAGVPVRGRLLAALGPRVLKLSADRSLGAHPYLVTPEYTRRAREIVGPGVLLAPEQKVVLRTDPDQARAIGRPVVEDPYLRLVNYTNNLRSLGYGDDDFGVDVVGGVGGASDRLIDALVLHGDLATIKAGLTAHLDAGADHVPVNLLTGPDEDPVAGFTALAHELFGEHETSE